MVLPSTAKTLFRAASPHFFLASEGEMIAMSRSVGMRSAMLSGVLSAGRPVEVISAMLGKMEGSEVTMKRVPLAMYRFLKMVHPGACFISWVSGR